MRITNSLLILCFLAIGVGSCTYENERDLGRLDRPCPDPLAVWDGEIELWMTQTCATEFCHANQIGDTGPLDNYDNAVAKADAILKRITRDQSEPGFMPQGGSPLDPCLIEGFREWIDNGTPRN